MPGITTNSGEWSAMPVNSRNDLVLSIQHDGTSEGPLSDEYPRFEPLGGAVIPIATGELPVADLSEMYDAFGEGFIIRRKPC